MEVVVIRASLMFCLSACLALAACDDTTAGGGTNDAGAEAGPGSDRSELIQSLGSLCLGLCSDLATCNVLNVFYDSLGECEDDCSRNTGVVVSEAGNDAADLACLNAMMALTTCVQGLSCSQLQAYLAEFGASSPCFNENLEQSDVCGPLQWYRDL
jgi:hypothetical protein